ncbi:MAG: hypothetical protein OHK0029_08210 [Armatimonadaceae bacterium]
MTKVNRPQKSGIREPGIPLLVVGMALGLLVNARLALLTRPELAPPAGLTVTQQKKLEEVATASLFGQFRSNLADFLWLKVDKYLHSGVDLRGMTEEERNDALRQVSNAGTDGPDGNRQHRSETTVVLPRQADWRGVLGDIERDVKPYMDMRNHSHRDPKEALPLFRLMTWSNPRFVPGYTTGAVMIAREEKAYKEALEFLQEGENNNPESIEIQATFSYLWLRGNRFGGKGSTEKALEHADKGVRLGMARDASTLTSDEVDALQDCFRWRVLSLRDSGQRAKAYQAAMEGLRIFPDDVICRNFLEKEYGIKLPPAKTQ